jgi:hypothetical protein
MNVYKVRYLVKRKFGHPAGKQRDVEEGHVETLAAEDVVSAIEKLKAGVPHHNISKIESVNLITQLTLGYPKDDFPFFDNDEAVGPNEKAP